MNKANKTKFNKAIRKLIKYNQLNDLRNRAENEDLDIRENERLFERLNRRCEDAWNDLYEAMEELPKYEIKRIEKSDLFNS